MMIKLTATLEKFDEMGEKTGWTYIVIPHDVAGKLKPGNKKSFRVKGFLDKHPIERVAIMPMGDGSFILPFNAGMRKGTGKRKGAQIIARLEVDETEIKPSGDFASCMEDEPKALEYFNELSKSHQNYFIKWIDTAKTEATRAKRIAQAINALAKGQHFGIMLRSLKAEKNNL